MPKETTSLRANVIPEPNTQPDLQAQHIRATTVHQTVTPRKLNKGM